MADGHLRDLGRFSCVLQGHDHSARLHPKGAHWKYACDGSDESYDLGAVRAFLAYGSPRHLSVVETIRWRERLDHEAGLLQSRPLPMRLPQHVSEATRRVAEGWALLVGLRDSSWGDEPFVFGRAFVIPWCGVTDEQARRAVRQLEEAGTIVRVGKLGRLILWRPGHPLPTLLEAYGSEDAVVDEIRRVFEATEVAA